ncbi:MAG: site-specific tyrosine recombinase XerD [Bacteroidota bacterium]
MNWNQAIKEFTTYLKIERGLSQNSIDSYTLDIQKLIKFLAESNSKETPIAVEEETVKDFVYQLSKVVNERSQARIISGLKSFFEFLVFEDLRKSNPMELVESPKIGRKLPETLSTSEIDAMVKAIDLVHPQGERNRAIIETLYGCGLRVSELINLRISDLFFDESFISVTGKGDKQRFVPIGKYTQKFITIYRDQVRVHQPIHDNFSDILFLNRRGKQLTRAMIFTLVRQLAKEANIQKKVSPHTFRHSFATHLLENGADLRAIQQMLGHESITTTEVYMHLDRSYLKEVVHKYHPWANS